MHNLTLTQMMSSYLRGVLDIGSSKTKYYLISFYNNKCEIEQSGKFELTFQAELDNNNNYISNELFNQWSTKFDHSELGSYCTIIPCNAIITAWGRNTINIEEVKNKFSGLDIYAKIISQEEEGLLGYNSVKYNKINNSNKLVTLDIGGGSYQIVYEKNDQIYVFEGNLGAESFKYQIREAIKTKIDNHNINYFSIGFLTTKDIEIAQELTKDLITNKIINDKNLINFFKSFHDATFIGLGGLINFCIRGITKGAPITSKLISSNINKLTQFGKNVTLAQEYYDKHKCFMDNEDGQQHYNLLFLEGILNAFNILTNKNDLTITFSTGGSISPCIIDEIL